MPETDTVEMRHADSMQAAISGYIADLDYRDLNDVTRHSAIVRVIDTLGALLGGFFGEPALIAREMAACSPMPTGSTVVGTRVKTTPDMAAFVNGTTARYVELNDVYHWPGSSGGHPSDVLMPIFGVAETTHASGREFITALVAGYEIYLRMSDAVRLSGFDCANFCCMGSAMGSGKLLKLSGSQLAEALSMAVVPNNALNQARTGHLTMWKAVAAGQSGRAGVFAALLAQAGMAGPTQPFEGDAGWCAHVAGRSISLAPFGGHGTPFKINDTLIKPRASCATTISSILAAEKAGSSIADPDAIESVKVEVYERAKIGMATGAHHWNPDSRETADHSIPYVVAAAIIDHRLGPTSFDEAHRRSPKLRRLLGKINVVSNEEFTRAYEHHPVLHCTRVTVRLMSGEVCVGESGGDKGDLSLPKSDAEISDKFRSLAEPVLGERRTDLALRSLWELDTVDDVATLPGLLAFA
jgi:2-methylcitrate dehydratase